MLILPPVSVLVESIFNHGILATFSCVGTNGLSYWNDFLDTDQYGSAAIGENGNYVYIGSMDGSLYALNFGTGKQEWKFTSDTTGINNTGNSMGRGSPVDVPVPLTPEEYIYAGSNNGYFYCLSAANGSMYWKYFTVGKVFTSPAVESGCEYASTDYSFASR